MRSRDCRSGRRFEKTVSASFDHRGERRPHDPLFEQEAIKASIPHCRLVVFEQNPLWVGEYWAGWFDHWGRNHATTNTENQVVEYESLLRQGYSINLYLLWGGTSFGWMSGANSNGKDYEPAVTS